MFCICVDVYRISVGDDYDRLYEVLSKLKNKNLKVNIVLIEKCKDIKENLAFEQNQCSRTATSIYKNGHDSIRLMKGMCYYDRS